MQARITIELLESSEAWGTKILREWDGYFNVRSSERTKVYTSLEEYLEFRYTDSSEN